MKQRDEADRVRVTVALDRTEQRALVQRAAELSIVQGRPVSLSEIARDVVRRGLQAAGPSAA
jgi:hypothetical protein